MENPGLPELNPVDRSFPGTEVKRYFSEEEFERSALRLKVLSRNPSLAKSVFYYDYAIPLIVIERGSLDA